jgi:Raf kinase inhibitor-like YbhB/YbcL family protein
MLTLTSPAFDHEDSIPPVYTCEGENINPPLQIFGVPGQAKALALIVEDPDVPLSLRPDGMFDHWIIFNLEPEDQLIPEDVGEIGVPGVNTRGELNYAGPCPPDREHRYFFRMYALDTPVDLLEGATKEELLEAMEGHIIEQAELMGTYERHE